MTGEEILKAMGEGFTLHSHSTFGFWLIDPFDARCINVHNGAAKSLVRAGRILQHKERGDQWFTRENYNSGGASRWKGFGPDLRIK